MPNKKRARPGPGHPFAGMLRVPHHHGHNRGGKTPSHGSDSSRRVGLIWSSPSRPTCSAPSWPSTGATNCNRWRARSQFSRRQRHKKDLVAANNGTAPFGSKLERTPRCRPTTSIHSSAPSRIRSQTMLACETHRGQLCMGLEFAPTDGVSGVIGLSGKAVGTVVLNMSPEWPSKPPPSCWPVK